MTIQLGQIAPDFEQESTHGRIRFHDWLGSNWCVLFSHPKNFTPVCTTELGEVARLRPEWDRRQIKPIGLSVDPEEDIRETQDAVLDFPMIADPDARVSTLYDMIHPESDPTVTVRSVFVIDPSKKGPVDPHLSSEHGSQFLGNSARDRQPSTHRCAQHCNPRELVTGSSRRDLSQAVRGGGCPPVPPGLQDAQAVPPHR